MDLPQPSVHVKTASKLSLTCLCTGTDKHLLVCFFFSYNHIPIQNLECGIYFGFSLLDYWLLSVQMPRKVSDMFGCIASLCVIYIIDQFIPYNVRCCQMFLRHTVNRSTSVIGFYWWRLCCECKRMWCLCLVQYINVSFHDTFAFLRTISGVFIPLPCTSLWTKASAKWLNVNVNVIHTAISGRHQSAPPHVNTIRELYLDRHLCIPENSLTSA